MAVALLARQGDPPLVGWGGAPLVELNIFEWLKIIGAVAGFLAGVAVWVWGRDRANSIMSAVAARELDHLTRRIDLIDLRLDQGRAKLEDLGERLQIVMLTIARVEEQLKEQTRLLADFRSGRRHYDPSSEP